MQTYDINFLENNDINTLKEIFRIAGTKEIICFNNGFKAIVPSLDSKHDQKILLMILNSGYGCDCRGTILKNIENIYTHTQNYWYFFTSNTDYEKFDRIYRVNIRFLGGHYFSDIKLQLIGIKHADYNQAKELLTTQFTSMKCVDNDSVIEKSTLKAE